MTVSQGMKVVTPSGRPILGPLHESKHTLLNQTTGPRARTFRVNTGNINNYVELKHKRYVNSAEELCACLNLQFSKLPEDTKIAEDETLMLADKKHREPLYERDDLKITLKLFVKDFQFESVRDAIQTTMNELKIDTIEQLILAFPQPTGEASSSTTNGAATASKHLHANSDWNGTSDAAPAAAHEDGGGKPTTVAPVESTPLDAAWFEAVLRVWTQIDAEFVATQRVFSVGVADFNLDALRALHDAAKLKPCVDHFNINSYCVLPPELQTFAREHDIQLLTHNDPKPFPLTDVFRSFCRCSSSEDERENRCSLFEPIWAARYTVWVRRRSLMAAKGYIVAFKSACATTAVNAAASAPAAKSAC